MTTGRKNKYTCLECGGCVVTVDRIDGTTPFMMLCRATDGCTGMMQSHFYRVPQEAEATWEWYRPLRADWPSEHGRDAGTFDHLRNGGLLPRKIRPDNPPVDDGPFVPQPAPREDVDDEALNGLLQEKLREIRVGGRGGKTEAMRHGVENLGRSFSRATASMGFLGMAAAALASSNRRIYGEPTSYGPKHPKKRKPNKGNGVQGGRAKSRRRKRR